MFQSTARWWVGKLHTSGVSTAMIWAPSDLGYCWGKTGAHTHAHTHHIKVIKPGFWFTGGGNLLKMKSKDSFLGSSCKSAPRLSDKGDNLHKIYFLLCRTRTYTHPRQFRHLRRQHDHDPPRRTSPSAHVDEKHLQTVSQAVYLSFSWCCKFENNKIIINMCIYIYTLEEKKKYNTHTLWGNGQ